MMKAGYICQVCGMKATDVQVRERAENEGVENYLYYVGRICGQNHRIRSPMCNSQSLDLLLPISQNGVGVPGPELTKEDADEINKRKDGDGD